MSITLSAAAALKAARAAVGTPNTPGYCLAWVYAMFGSVTSAGPGHGHFSTAMDGWNYATEKHTDISPPAGVPVYFGISPTRTDRNKRAGDITISDGGGFVLATDYPRNGVIGRLTIAQRAAQTQRPYLGWTGDFLGHDVEYGQAITSASTGTVIKLTATPLAPTPGDTNMFVIENTTHGWFTLVTKQYVRHLAKADAILLSKVTSESDEIHQLADGDVVTVFNALNIPADYRNPNNPKVLKTRVWSK